MATASAATAPADSGRRSDTRERIMDAALRVSEEGGLRGTTMDDVAREAGLARITLYRHFDSKDALVRAVVLRETERFFAVLDAATESCRRAAERVVEGFAAAIEFLQAHALLQRLLRDEPDAVLPYLTGRSAVVAAARRAVAERLADPALEDALPPEDAESAAELQVRVMHSFLLSPDDALELNRGDGGRRFAWRHFVPSLGTR